ncbi:MAG: BsuPI-related putative proteinase inhibitor, partial [Candidatus Bathyarchaeia archaeon]
GDLILVAEIPKADFRVGETIAVSTALKTTTKSSLNLGFPSSQRFNVLVYDEGGRLVYNWSAHQTFKHEYELYQVLMVPDKEIRETVVWDLRDDSGRPVPPGRYYLVAETPFFVYGYIPGLVQGSGTTHIVRANPDISISTGKLYFTVNP